MADETLKALPACPFCGGEMVYARNPEYCWHPHGVRCPISNTTAFYRVDRWVESLSRPADQGAAVREAAKAVLDGWTGQNEIGERWHDEVADMEALGKALAGLGESRLATESAERVSLAAFVGQLDALAKGNAASNTQEPAAPQQGHWIPDDGPGTYNGGRFIPDQPAAPQCPHGCVDGTVYVEDETDRTTSYYACPNPIHGKERP